MNGCQSSELLKPSSDFEDSPVSPVRSSLAAVGRAAVRRTLSTSLARDVATTSQVPEAGDVHDSSQTESDSDAGVWEDDNVLQEQAPAQPSEQEIKPESPSEVSSLAIQSYSGASDETTTSDPTHHLSLLETAPAVPVATGVRPRKRKKIAHLTLLTTVRHLEAQVEGLKAMLRKPARETKLQQELTQDLINQMNAKQCEERQLVGKMLKQIILNQAESQDDNVALAEIFAQFQSSQGETQKKQVEMTKKQTEMNNLLDQLVNEKRVRTRREDHWETTGNWRGAASPRCHLAHEVVSHSG